MRHVQSWNDMEPLENRLLLAVNDTPVNTVPGTQSTPEDTSLVFSAGNSNLVAISDGDAGSGLMSITLVVGSGTATLASINGLTFSVGGGTADSTMIFTGTVSNVNTAFSTLTFTPSGNFTGTASLTLITNDQGNTGTGGPKMATDTFLITVIHEDYAPVLTPVAPTLTPIARDNTTNSGALVSSVVGSSISNPISGAAQGIAIYSDSATFGAWQFSINGGTTWSAVGTVAANNALLLRASDRIRFVPDGSDSEIATLSYYAWDQTGATTGAQGTKVDATSRGGTTPFSTGSDTASIIVNDAPVLTPGNPSLTGITEDDATNSGQLVSDVEGATVSDSDTNAVRGIAVVSVTPSNGTWQYSTNGGTTWTTMNAVSVTSALLLGSADKVRFVPSASGVDTANFSYYAWDQTSGVAGTKVDASFRGGSTAFSTASDTASITVNDAPVLTATSPALTGITEDDTNSAGQTVSNIVGTSIADDGGVKGIAIYGTASGSGAWQYSRDGGTTWSAVGAVSGTSALLLGSADQVRFMPNSSGADAASISYYAWDQTSGAAGTKVDVSSRGGATAFSTAFDTASIAVSAVNDALVLTAASPTLTGITEDDTTSTGQTVSNIVGTSIADDGGVKGIAIYGTSDGSGSWQYSRDGGTTWSAAGAVSGTSALLLGSADQVRFVPNSSGADAASISYYAWDQTSGAAGTKVDVSSRGGSTAFSTAFDTASIAVTQFDLRPTFAFVSIVDSWLPGTTGIARVVVTNQGAGKLTDSFTVSLYAVSANGDMVFLGGERAQTVQLQPTTYRAYAIQITVPSNAVLPPGNYTLMCRVQYDQQTNDVTYGHTFVAQEAYVDLTALLPAVNLPSDIIVPGDRGLVAVRVANSGNVLAAGGVRVSVYASASGQVDGDAVLLVTMTSVVNLPAGGPYAQYVLNVNVPQHGLDCGEHYYIIASVVAGDGITESQNRVLNNTAASNSTRDYEWQFGHVGHRSNVVLTLDDPSTNVQTNFSLVGGGLGQVSLDGNSGLLDVSLAGTSSSSLARVVSADASSLGDFTAGDDLGTLLAGQTTFLGNLSFGGGLRRMVAAGIGSDANVQQTLTIGHVIAPAAADVTSLSLGVVYDLNINSESPLMALTANAWNDEIGGQNADVITAPWLSQLTVQGGFSASLALDPTDAVPGTRVAPGNMVLGAAVIGGSVTSPQWNIAGKVGGIATGDVDGLKLTAQSVAKATIRGSLSNSVLTLEQALSARQQSLAKLTVTGAVEATDILSIGNIGSVSVGRISGSRVFAGVNNGVTGLPVAGNFVAANRVGLQAVISQFAVTGLNTFGAAATLFEDSMVAAGNLGKVRVEGVDASNGQTFGFAADTSIRDLAWTEDNILVGRFAGTSWRLGPSLPEGDFMVRVV